MKDELGNRMKTFYEERFKTFLPRRGYTIIRIDGKAFHTYTKGLLRPFDQAFMDDMDTTTRYLCENIQGAKFGYTQSDEISVLLTDFDSLETQAWFDNELQKMVSVAASLATAKFNQARMSTWLREWEDTQYEKPSIELIHHLKLAHFDARVFQLPTKMEVINYFIWRQKDCIRNSISSVAQSEFSQKELHGKTSQQKIEMLLTKDVDWEGLPDDKKYGREAVKENYEIPVKSMRNGGLVGDPSLPNAIRTRWISMAAKPFYKHHFLSDRILEQI